MKKTLLILSIALLPTLAQADRMLDRQEDVLTVSKAEPAKQEQTNQDLLQSSETKKESSASKAETNSSKQAK